MDTTPAKSEFGPLLRALAHRYFEGIRFPGEGSSELARLSEQGFVVHVMGSTSWLNYLYLSWALVRRGLPPIRAVVNLRPWLTRPWRRTAQRGDVDVRFTYARRKLGSGLVFLKHSVLGTGQGKYFRDDPFPALVALARRSERAVYLVPELFVWETHSKKLQPSLLDRVFGSPETPGFIHSVVAFWRNRHRAHFRVGTPVDLRQFVLDHSTESDAVLARKVRSALHLHLSRESRSVFGPPLKSAERAIEQTLRDRELRETTASMARRTGQPEDTYVAEARANLKKIAARLSPTVVAILDPLMAWVFNRIYEGIEVDEDGLARAMGASKNAPLVLCPSHKSHVDYLVLSWVLWRRGYNVPFVAAGANLSFFPLGPILRRAGAFFLRRSFKGDGLYASTFKAYLKRLVLDGVHQEFFPEGGRSRTGKLLQPKLGMITWETEMVLDGVVSDLHFVPVAIDYEKVIESRAYVQELAGAEKKPEGLKSLLSLPKVLTKRFGRIHVAFAEPISVRAVMASRGLSPERAFGADEKRGLVRALGNRMMYAIAQVSTVTAPALVATVLLASRPEGTAADELARRIDLLRTILREDNAPLPAALRDAPSNPLVPGPISAALTTFEADGLLAVRADRLSQIYKANVAGRPELAYYRNTLINRVAPFGIVAAAIHASHSPLDMIAVREHARFLSRLFKLEFTYRSNLPFEAIFQPLYRRLMTESGRAPDGDPIVFFADLLRDHLQAYRFVISAVRELCHGPGLDRKSLLRTLIARARGVVDQGMMEGESTSRPTFEHALSWLIEQGWLVENNRRLVATERLQPESAKAARLIPALS